jgi:hypothetical protein
MLNKEINEQSESVSDADDAKKNGYGSVPKRTLENYVLTAAIFVLFTAQGAIALHYFHKYVEAYYPINIDQLPTYNCAYQRHFLITGEPVKTKPITPLVGGDMKGFVVPLLSLASTFIFGTHRLSVALINFLFLLVAELSIICGLRTMRGLRCACLALGLFLSAQTHYFSGGGLNDMRLDYAGMATMGLVYIFALKYLENRSKKYFFLAVSALCLATFTRSIVLIYWTCALALATTCSFLISKFYRSSESNWQLTKSLTKLTGAALGVLAVYTGIYWSDFASYYVNCKVGGEDLMRLREAGLRSVLDRLAYYPRSFHEHFRRIIDEFLFFLPIAWFFQPQQREKTSVSRVMTPVNVMTASLFSAVFACVTYYAPSPLVIGILTIPLSIWCALVLDSFLARHTNQGLAILIAAIVVSIGGYTYVQELTRPTYPPHADLRDSRVTEDVLSDLNKALKASDGSPKTIYWCQIHGGINQQYFEINNVEHTGHPLPFEVRHIGLRPYPGSSLQESMRSIEIADYVLITKPPPTRSFEYDGATSVRTNYPEILKSLNKSFKLISEHEYRLPGYETDSEIQLYERRASILESNVDKGLTRNTDLEKHEVRQDAGR